MGALGKRLRDYKTKQNLTYIFRKAPHTSWEIEEGRVHICGRLQKCITWGRPWKEEDKFDSGKNGRQNIMVWNFKCTDFGETGRSWIREQRGRKIER